MVVGNVDGVQVIPSGEVAAFPSTPEIAQKTVPFQAIPCQKLDDGNVRVVHVIPSGEVIALLVNIPTTQNTLPFHAIDSQLRASVEVVATQIDG